MERGVGLAATMEVFSSPNHGAVRSGVSKTPTEGIVKDLRTSGKRAVRGCCAAKGAGTSGEKPSSRPEKSCNQKVQARVWCVKHLIFY